MFLRKPKPDTNPIMDTSVFLGLKSEIMRLEQEAAKWHERLMKEMIQHQITRDRLRELEERFKK